MNKIQYIKLLELRGITELVGKSIAQAVLESGGQPTLEEMVEVNKLAMNHFIDLNQELRGTISELREENETLSRRSRLLSALHAAGVDNWEGMEAAEEILEQWNKEN